MDMGTFARTPPPADAWPALDYAPWRETGATLQRYVQLAGKLRIATVPPSNHWWSSALAVTARGLSTLALPHPRGAFELHFDFVDHELVIQTSWGDRRVRALAPEPVAEFYRDTLAILRSMGIEVEIWEVPVEVEDQTPCTLDQHHREYDAQRVERFFRALLSANEALEAFRGRFTGKCSPVNFYWGSFDLAVTRFSGRPAPERFRDAVMREAYAEEVCSAGFWPGDDRYPHAAFYAYAAPEPEGFREAAITPAYAHYDLKLGEFLLPWEKVRAAEDPRAEILAFCQSTYEAAAEAGRWDREALERPLILPQRRRAAGVAHPEESPQVVPPQA